MSRLRLLVFGQTGQLARALIQNAAADFDVRSLARAAADLTDPAACAAAIATHRPAVVINAAAYTAVDRAEADEATAMQVNGAAPAAMARAAAALDIPFLHVSTDYVFDGSGVRPWRPGDTPGPLGAYGRSKLRGEQAVQAVGGRYAILRTSWVFSAQGANFVKTMLRLGQTRDSLAVVADQTGGPTAAGDLAAALLTMAQAFHTGRAIPGIYHFSGAPDVSWAGFAREIFRQAGLATRVTDIATADYPTPARRPANSRLDCASTEAVFGIARPDWRASLTGVLKNLGEIV